MDTRRKPPAKLRRSQKYLDERIWDRLLEHHNMTDPRAEDWWHPKTGYRWFIVESILKALAWRSSEGIGCSLAEIVRELAKQYGSRSILIELAKIHNEEKMKEGSHPN